MSFRQLLSPILRRLGVSNSTSNNGQRIVARDLNIQTETTKKLKASPQVNQSSSFDEIRSEELDIPTSTTKRIPTTTECTSSQECTTFVSFSKQKTESTESTNNFRKGSSYEDVTEANIHMKNHLTGKNGKNNPTNNNSIKETKSNDELFVMTTKQFNKTTTKYSNDDETSKGQNKRDSENSATTPKSILPSLTASTNYPGIMFIYEVFFVVNES